jgi:hypothetical protein
MNLTEAADHLSLSVKTLERAIKQGKLAATKHIGKNGGYVYDIEQSELDRFQVARSAPVHNPAVVVDEQTTLAPVRPDTIRPNATQADIVPFMADAFALALAQNNDAFLTIKEAADAFNCSQSAIKVAIKADAIKLHRGIGRRGASVVKRSDVEKWIRSL